MIKLFKKPIPVIFPSSIRSKGHYFEWFSGMLHETAKGEKYLLDLYETSFIDGNLCAILGAIINLNRTQGSTFEIRKSRHESVNITLEKNGFTNWLNNKKSNDTGYNSIPFKIFNSNSQKESENYINSNLLDKIETPKISDGAKNKILRSIFELFQNAVMHSGSNELFVCGQFYRIQGKMALTMVDIGKTIQKNVNDFKKDYKDYNGKESIEWAVEKYNSTKPKNELGGLGIDLIRTFISQNNGLLQIRSSKGFWEQKGKTPIFAKEYDIFFGGTIVNIEFNLNDNTQYTTKEEVECFVNF